MSVSVYGPGGVVGWCAFNLSRICANHLAGKHILQDSAHH